MPTSSEQKALAFVAVVVLLAGAARVLAADPQPVASPAEQQALARQASAADSAAARERSVKAQKGTRSRRVAHIRRNGGVDTVAGVPSVPFSDVRPGFPPPSPRIDTDARGELGASGPGSVGARRASDGGLWGSGPGSGGARRASDGGHGAAPQAHGPLNGGPSPEKLDLDRATAEEIDRLPRIGPALARRIVANRDSLGGFGSLAALRRVKGIGPATIERLAPLVTFSAPTRH